MGVFVCKCSYPQDMCFHKEFCDICGMEMISCSEKLGDFIMGYLAIN